MMGGGAGCSACGRGLKEALQITDSSCDVVLRNGFLKLEPPLGRHPALCVGLQLHDARPLVPAREVRVIVQVLLFAHCLAEW
jgi:hypothetical protein